jgi:tartrate-resistant acid phosphatase type 5
VLPEVRAQHSKVENPQSVPAFDAKARLTGETLSFLAFGDWGTGSRLQREVAKAMAAKHAADPVVAALTVGDNFYGRGVSGTDDPQWDSKFERMYPRDELDVPFYATLGNHDYGKDPDAEVAYTGTRLADGSTTRWHMPGRYWTHAFRSPGGGLSVRVVGLDTQTFVTGGAEQRMREQRWLDSVLAFADEDWTIVIGHHPVYSNGVHGNTIGMQRHVQPILEKHGVDAYVCGHDHDLQLLEPVQGVRYIVSGGGGGSRNVRWADNTLFAATNGGFVWMQFSKREMLVQFLDPDGAVLYAWKSASTR